MNYIYLSTVREFVRKRSSDIINFFQNQYKRIYDRPPKREQIEAWRSSINYLRNAFDCKDINNYLILVFEYQLPFSNERIDLLIFGRDKTNKPTVIVFELKGWKKAKETSSKFIVSSDLGKSVHPEYQVENYTGKLQFSHSEAENFNIISAVLMYNGISKAINLKFKKTVFFKNELSKLRDFIINNLPYSLEQEVVNRFLYGQYIQSKRLFDAIKEHFEELKNQSYLALAENGWGLSSEQLMLIQEIIQDLESDKKDIVYLIQGAPGSGKTLVAIHLLLSSMTKKYQTILAYRNNRLINSIRDIFNSIKRGLSAPIKFYSVGTRYGFRGVAEKSFNGPYFDIVIYDEAQRMTKKNIYYALQRARITVFFYDESQILNAEEEGFTENFKEEARKQKKKIKERFLRGFYRVKGGSQYHKFIEILLKNPEKINNDTTRPWKNNYDFRVVERIETLFSLLEEKKGKGFKVALIAAFTESPGDLNNMTSIKNLRIGYPLYSGLDLYQGLNKNIYWLMHPKNDYVPFWVKGESNKLERCASIYGCQGFETDFAGVIWGRDFVFRNGKWTPGENCEDNIGRPSLKELISRANEGDSNAYNLAKHLLINRYRIFLTRGIKGTYIFCEDKETKQILTRIYNEFIA